MILIYSIVLICFLLLYLRTKNKKVFFLRAIAEYVYESKPDRYGNKQKKEDIATLYIGDKDAQKKEAVEKITIVLLFLFASALLGVFITLNDYANRTIENGYIIRNPHGGGVKEIILLAGNETETMEIPLTVEEQRYGEAELEKLYENYIVELEREMLSKNQSVEKVQENLNFVSNISGYPFQNAWECSDYHIIGFDGKIQKEIEGKEGIPIKITASISYFDWKREYIFFLKVVEKEKTLLEEKQNALKKELQTRNTTRKEEKEIALPDTWEEESIRWKEKRKDSSIAIFLLGIIAAVLTYFMKDREITQKMNQRREEMLLEYPEIISKITLYMGAGMVLRQIIEKLAKDYNKKKENGVRSYAYEEILHLYQEMERGISEAVAYEKFGKRCKVQAYMKLGSLLAQNSKKGNSTLLDLLKQESEEAFNGRKNTAKRKGEEAGTKLLLPMMIMLAIVMIIVIVPSFFSFQI